MTTQIIIKVPADIGMPGETVATRLRKLAETDGSVTSEKPRDFRLPLGQSRTLDVAPGRYVVETSWRTGDITYEDCLAAPDTQVHVEVYSSPRRRAAKVSDRDFTRASAGGMLGRPSPALDEHSCSVFDSAGVSDSWAFVCDRHQLEQRSSLSAEHQPARRSNDLNLRPRDSARNWVMFWGADSWMVSSLPIDNLAGNAFAILRSSPDSLPFVTVSDAETSVLADMLPSGNSEAAHRYAIGAAEELSLEMIEMMAEHRPLELCAYGYAECENFHDDKWPKALSRAMRHQGWLPDITVILGWRALMQSRTESELDEAGRLLETAVSAGVPFYSRGVRLLSEALLLISDLRSEHACSASRVKAVAAKTVRTEAFTSVRL